MSKYTFPERESKLIEFKSIVPSFEKLLTTCVAFANAAGGKIIIGVDDETRAVIGVTDEDRNRIYDAFQNSLYDSTQPNLIAQIYEQSYGNQTVLIIEIPVSPKKPYFLKAKGMKDGTYIRVGSSTRKANQEYIDDLIREGQRIKYDEEIVHGSIDILSNELLKQFYKSKVTTRQLIADKIVASNSANKEVYSPTVAGVLLFSEFPHMYIPEALIKCTRYSGEGTRDIIRTEEIVGPIEQQAAECLRLLEMWLTKDYELSGAKLKGKSPIPYEAQREAVLNALLHRKYLIPGAIQVGIYDNRLEIFSPGCFPGLVDINSLGDGTTYLRNPTLARLAHRMHIVESRGRGIRMIIDSCKKVGLPNPEFHEEGDFVKVVFYFGKDPKQFATEEEAIFEYLKVNKVATSKKIASYLGVSQNTAIRKLNHLISEKRVIKAGNGPLVRYSKSKQAKS